MNGTIKDRKDTLVAGVIVACVIVLISWFFAGQGIFDV